MRYRSVFAPNLFEDRTIIVTGAGSGIGRCIAHELASLGAHVVLTGRKPEKLSKVAAEIREDRGVCSSQAFDIRDESAVQQAVKTVVAERGVIHGLVNNAGGQYLAPLTAISRVGWEAVVNNNLTGGFLMAREVFNQSMCAGGGSIVNMLADMWGGMPGMGHSGAARAGMLNFSETAAVEWAHAGVRVNAVAPGWVASSGLDNYLQSEVVRTLRGHVPLQRLASEAEISAPIVFLLSPAAAFITGQCIAVDGGASRNTKMYPLQGGENSAPYEGFHRAIAPQVLRNA